MFFFDKIMHPGRQQRAEAHRFLHRLVDTTMSLVLEADDQRSDPRTPRCMPVLLCPFDGEPRIEHASYAMTQNISSTGMALWTRAPLDGECVLVGFWFDGRALLLSCKVRRQQPVGGGFWYVGLEAEAIVPADNRAALAPLLALAENLVPETAAAV
jgi:hypothetical protein